MKQHLPNFLTCLNLACGSIAVVCAAGGDLNYAAYLVILAAIFDFADGFVARLLHVTSAIGKELDSLADMVTFGLVPGIVLMQLMAVELGEPVLNAEALYSQPLLLLPLLIPVFSALRLAKFNLDTRQSDGFIGVPTPASALWVIAVPLVQAVPQVVFPTVSFGLMFLIGTAIVLPILMVSNIPLIALKFKSFKWKGNEFRFTLIVSSLAMMGIFGPLAIPIALCLYLILSIIQNAVQRKK